MNKFKKLSVLLGLTTSLLAGCALTDSMVGTKKADRPNIVIVLTDDQGYGDIGINGNPIIKTPNLDALAQQSANLTNFHVDPSCSPTRASLLTGKNSLKAGVWHTVMVRYLLGPEHKTLAEHLQEGGYDTAIFGKWHLGDNYPFRPQDQGFDEVFIHGGGGVGQTPDYWGNTQFNDTYYRNGEEEKTKGYATTVWFDETIKFIDEQRDNPYFAYVSLNAPHGPYRAPEEYITPYLEDGLNRYMASFYGMITHLDEQVLRLREHIKARGEEDNTIFIFMTDNGSAYRPTNYNNEITPQHKKLKAKYPDWQPNAGLRGYKISTFEGGHRVPFFISYPNGDIQAGNYDALTAHYDLMPTLLELAGLEATSEKIDGNSLVNLITKGDDTSFEDRSVVITNQRVSEPTPERPVVVLWKNWRLLSENGKERLYDLNTDPSQMKNVFNDHPQVVAKMRKDREQWWQESKEIGFHQRYIGVGNEAENPVRLNAMDWMEIAKESDVPWFIGHQAPAEEYNYTHWLTKEDKFTSLPWYIDVEVADTYKVRPYYHDIPAATPVQKKFCVVEADGKQYVQRVWGRASHCVVDVPLATGQQKITAWFTDDKHAKTKEKAAFYLYIERP